MGKTNTSTSKLVSTQVTPQQDKFLQMYLGMIGNTAGQIEKSAIAAGYKAKTAASAASHMLKRPRVAARLLELRKQLEHVEYAAEIISKDGVRQKLYSLYAETRDKGKYAESIRALELLGKDMGMFTEQISLDPATVKALEGRQAEAALQISAMILSGGGANSPEFKGFAASLPVATRQDEKLGLNPTPAPLMFTGEPIESGQSCVNECATQQADTEAVVADAEIVEPGASQTCSSGIVEAAKPEQSDSKEPADGAGESENSPNTEAETPNAAGVSERINPSDLHPQNENASASPNMKGEL